MYMTDQPIITVIKSGNTALNFINFLIHKMYFMIEKLIEKCYEFNSEK